MALLTVADIESWIDEDIATAREEEVERCINAASAWLESVTGRSFEKGASATTYYLNGDDACGPSRSELWLNPGHRPVIHSGGDLLTVTEDGASLTVAVGYSTTASVIIVNANLDRRCYLKRNSSGPWATGIQNVAVTYKHGYAAGSIPANVVQVAAEAAILFLREPKWIGKANESKAGSAITIAKALSPMSQSILSQLTVA